jgi:hypothetical protein
MSNTINFKHSDNVIIVKKSDNYRGYHGIVRSYIPSKYDVEILVNNVPRRLLINKTWVKKYSDEQVKVIKGDYRNVIGKIINRYDAEVMVNLTAIGKDHKYKKKDVFYTDLLLANNSYVQVSSVEYIGKELKITGYEMRNDIKLIVKSVIDNSLIKKIMPGFEMYVTQEMKEASELSAFRQYMSTGVYRSDEDPDDKNYLEEMVYTGEDKEENGKDENDEDEEDDEIDGEQKENMLEASEDDMKVSFADIERSAYGMYGMSQMTREQEEYQTYIRQLGPYLDLVDKFDIFQKVDAIMKNIVEPGYMINAMQQGESKEVAMETYNELRSMNLKFIIACLVFYDLNSVRNISYSSFFNNLPKTYFNVNEDMDKILRNIFLADDVPRFKVLTNDEMNSIRKWVETDDKKSLIEFSLKRCDLNLRSILNVGIMSEDMIESKSVKRIDGERGERVEKKKEMSKEQMVKNRIRDLKINIEKMDKMGKRYQSVRYERELFDLEMREFLNLSEKELIKKIEEFEVTSQRLGDPKGKLLRKINMLRKAVFAIRYKSHIQKGLSKAGIENDIKKQDGYRFAYDNFEDAESVLGLNYEYDKFDDEEKIIKEKGYDDKKKGLFKIYVKFIKQYNEYLDKKKKEQEQDLLISKMGKLKV